MKVRNIILIFICMCSLSACEYDYCTGNTYTKNETNGEYIVYLRYRDTIGMRTTKNVKSVVLPHQKTQLIQYQYGIVEGLDNISTAALSSGYIYVLNTKDSTYFKFSNWGYDLSDPTSYYYRDSNTQKYGYSKIGVTNFYIVINDSLVSKMVKDKQMADSIMNIWY